MRVKKIYALAEKISFGNNELKEKLLRKYFRIKNKIYKAKRLVPCTYLCLKYPFLKIGGDRNKKFFQTSCWYYSIDNGWRKAFGITLCDELKECLKRYGILKTYVITDIKEKYGELNIDDNGAPEEVHDILLKYEYISAHTCIVCGRRAKYVTRGWILPYCEDCMKSVETTEKPQEYYKDMDWYGWKQ